LSYCPVIAMKIKYGCRESSIEETRQPA